jgi:hypothetical protein
MSKEPLSLFHEHLLLFLQDDLHQKKSVEGWDEATDPEIRTYRDILSKAMRNAAPLPLQEIVERYKHIFEQRGPVHLEHKILEAFPEQELKLLELPPLRMYRGLPRLYRNKSSPSLFSRIMPDFSHLPSLKRVALAKSLYSLYAHMPIPKDAKVVLLTDSDNGSDYFLALEAISMLKRSFPFLDLQLVIFKSSGHPLKCNANQFIWEGSEKQLQDLRGADLLLQIPSELPMVEKLFNQIEAIDDPRPLPKFETLKRHGAVRICPSQTSHSTGLHFLEKGIFLRQAAGAVFSEFENESMMHWLFGQIYPGPQEITEYRRKNRFFLSRATSQSGIFVYLHALCKSLEWDTKAIDLCTPNAESILDYFQSRIDQKMDLLEGSCKIARITLCIGSYTTTWELQETGKTLRILSPESLSHLDVQRLIAFSEDFTGISDEDSFSEAVSANKGFFFDPSNQNRYLIKDLIALAENRIAPHRSTLGILRLYMKVFEHHLPSPEEGEWVDEIAIQCEEKMPLAEIVEKIGLYLQDPDALAGFKKLNRLIAKENSCNDFFKQIVQRAVCHRRRPQIARLEEEAVSGFIVNQISLSHLVFKLKDATTA